MAVPILTCHCCRPIFGHLKPRNLASILGPRKHFPSVQNTSWSTVTLSERARKNYCNHIIKVPYRSKSRSNYYCDIGICVSTLTTKHVPSRFYSDSIDKNHRKILGSLPAHPSVLQVLSQMEDSMRYHGYSTLRIGFIVVIIAGFGVYLFRDYLRDNMADEVSSVASRSLADDQVRQMAQDLTINLLNSLMTDVQVQNYTIKFLKDVVQKPETQKALIQLLYDVVNDEEMQETLAKMVRQVVVKTVEEEAFRRRLASNLLVFLEDPLISDTLIGIMKNILQDDSVREVSKIYLRDVISSARVTERATELGRNVVHGVVADQKVQQRTGDAMWSAIRHTVTPKWWKADEKQSKSHNNGSTEKKSSSDNK